VPRTQSGDKKSRSADERRRKKEKGTGKKAWELRTHSGSPTGPKNRGGGGEREGATPVTFGAQHKQREKRKPARSQFTGDKKKRRQDRTTERVRRPLRNAGAPQVDLRDFIAGSKIVAEGKTCHLQEQKEECVKKNHGRRREGLVGTRSKRKSFLMFQPKQLAPERQWD